MEFPVEFKVCPACGSNRRVIEEEVNDAIALGQMSEGSHGMAQTTRSLIFNPASMPKISGISRKVPAIFGYYDICAECGTLYCIHLEKGEAMVEAQGPPPESGHGFPFIGRG